MKTAPRHFATTFFLISITCHSVLAGDWPTWRHDRLRTGVTDERLDLPLEQVWAFRSRSSRQAPAPAHPHQEKYPWVTHYTLPISAAGDSLFFSSAADGRIVCLDAASGKMRWEFLAGAAVNRVPTIWQQKVFAGSDDGHVYCLDATTGKLVWKYNAAPSDRWFLSYGKPVSVWPVRTDVLVDADPEIQSGRAAAYFCAGVFPHEGTFLYALDAETGELLWRNGTQAESGWRVSMAPAGHLFMTRKSIWVPRDFWGYFVDWGTLISFDRDTGQYPTRFGPDKDLEWPNQTGHFWPVFGVRHGDVQYFGTHAVKTITAGEEKKQTELWREEIPGRLTDIDSVLSVRYKQPVFFRWDPDLSTIVYAGGVVYQAAFETDPNKGVGTGIYARNAIDGKLLWSAEVAERANQLIVANGRLFASTRQGTIYCFAPQGSPKHGVIEEAVDDGRAETPLASAAQRIIEQTGVKAGYALVLDCDSGALAYELARQTELYVIAVFHDVDKAAAARKVYSGANRHVSRMIAHFQKEGTKLPFTSYLADLVVSESAAAGGTLPQDTQELQRMLKPVRGVALIGGGADAKALNQWVAAQGGQPPAESAAADWEISQTQDMQWAKHVRPRLDDAGGWTHAFGDAGHTGCSHDGALKPPLGVVWYGTPQLGESGPGALISDGVLLLCDGGDLLGCDQYTGREMWRHGQGRTDTVAAPGSVFLRYLEVIARLDPSTGEQIQAYRPPFEGGQWTAIAASPDGATLYLAASGKNSSGKDWTCMLAMDVPSGKPHWLLGGPEEQRSWGGWNAIGSGYVYVLGDAVKEGAQRDAAIAELRAYLKANDPARLEKFDKELKDRDFRLLTTIDAKTGKILYERAVDITNAGGRFLPQPAYGAGKYARHYNPNVGFWMMAEDDVVIFCTQSGADKGWRQWPTGAYKQRGIAVHDGATGKLLWNKPCNYRTRPVVVDNTIFAEPWAYDLKTGNRKTRVHPISGQLADWAWCRSDKQCGSFSASRHFLFGRSLGVGYHDLLTDSGLYTFWHSRMSCSFDAFSGGGMMIKPPLAVYCRCSWSLPFTVAMGQVASEPAAPQNFAQPGSSLPVKHLYLDVGANGDRRDHEGNLWIHTNHREGHPLLLGYNVEITKHEGAEDVRRSATYTPIENTDVPFVFASALRGLKSCVLPVNRPEDGKVNFTVRLGFAALPGDEPGQRVFDVKLDGRTVLTNFDIVKETAGPDRALWKEFSAQVGENLTVELVAKSASPSSQQMPLLNGIVLLRK